MNYIIDNSTKMQSSYRHEYKYIISDLEEEMLINRISPLMKKDEHCGTKGFYKIRSAYFDDYNDSSFYDNENGLDHREKIRIRMYDCNDKYIVLERKRKDNCKTQKEACRITRDMCSVLLSGGSKRIIDDDRLSNIGRGIVLSIQNRGLVPKVLVEYDRIPFIYNAGNVRVTIDKNIVSSSRICDFFEHNISRRPIMKMGYSILEVKWDSIIPNYIFSTCQLDGLVQTACSKYYLCRKFHD